MQIFANTNYNFLRWRWQAVALSALVIGSGLVSIAVRGLPLGIDFSGGTIVVVKFEQPVTEDAVRGVIPGEKVVQQYGDAADHEILIRLPQVTTEEEGASLEEDARAVLAALEQADVGPFEVLSTEIVGPIIGRELQRKGIYATIASLLGITIYIALRFRPSFGAGAAVATIHDILVTVTLLTFAGFDLSLNIIAAILTIAGYSVNDTIVIFDRVRENLRGMRRDSLEAVVNRSVNQTLGRTIITSGTTLMAVLALYVFGGEVLKGFAFALIVGVIAGTYSTVFIAAALAIVLSGRQAKARTVAAAKTAAGGRKAS